VVAEEEMTPAVAAVAEAVEAEAPTPTPPGKATLVAPANNKTCETGTSVSDTQSTVTFNWNASANTNTYDVQITNLNTSTATNKNGVSSTSTTATLDKGCSLFLESNFKEVQLVQQQLLVIFGSFTWLEMVWLIMPRSQQILQHLRLDQQLLLVRVKRRLLGTDRILIVETRLVIRFM